MQRSQGRYGSMTSTSPKSLEPLEQNSSNSSHTPRFRPSISTSPTVTSLSCAHKPLLNPVPEHHAHISISGHVSWLLCPRSHFRAQCSTNFPVQPSQGCISPPHPPQPPTAPQWGSSCGRSPAPGHPPHTLVRM